MLAIQEVNFELKTFFHYHPTPLAAQILQHSLSHFLGNEILTFMKMSISFVRPTMIIH